MSSLESLAPFAVVSLLAIALVGCGHSLEYVSTNPSPRPLAARAPASVEVYTASPPTRPHVEVGLFEIEQRTPASGGTPAMIEKLRERAAQVGCDALVVSQAHERIQSVSTRSHGTVHSGTVHTTGTGTVNVVRKHTASCIVFTEQARVGSAPRDTLTSTE